MKFIGIRDILTRPGSDVFDAINKICKYKKRARDRRFDRRFKWVIEF